LWLANVPEGIYLHSLRWLFLAGEPLKETLINQWRQKFPQSGKIINLYGPTETTLAKCYYEIPAEPTPGIQPIGLPIPETQALIFTANHQLCGIGEIGEIVLRTPFRSLGYINTSENNSSRFVNNPFRNDENDQLYYTGDLGRYRLNGSLEILGRRDYQVKIRGVRIEPGEIEAVLLQYSDIHQAVVIAREDIPGDQRLVAYIIPNQNSAPSINDLRQFLSTKLPQYMIPSAFVMLNVLPLNPNGKVDRRSLPAPDLSQQEPQNTFVAARNDVERQLIEIWEQVLGVHPIGIKDNFFELGGHSLLAVKLFWQIEQKFSKTLPLATLFQSGNIENLAHQISLETKSNNSYSSLVEIQPLGSKPPFFCVHGLGGEILCFRDLARHLGTDQPFYALQPQGLNGNQPFHTKVEDMASHYIQEIKTIQPQGPYFLGGYSFGGVVVFEMARQLHEQGEKVDLLAVLDTCLADHIQRASFWKRILLHFHNIRQKGLSYLLYKVISWSQVGKDQIKNRYRFYLESINALPDNDKHLQIIGINTEAASKYIFPVYPGQMTLIRTKDESRKSAIGLQYDPQFGWGDLVMGGLDIQYVPGSHLSLLEEPHVQVVAEKLKDCLGTCK
jgi:thioesterase domain-containing protein/acyl carrier protein